ncbi:hypothetical protein DFH09DRAFT_1479786 [Mycena vulgaris]|nr:hypothetical protein DFH09DRAFT_1479786 [Mycena vulgaris]
MADSSNLRKIVEDTTAEISHHQALLKKLRGKRSSAKRQLDSLVYPVLTLPPEITSEIFLHCLPTSYTDRERNVVDPDEPPMLLTHVCRTWREIAISTHALWAEIDFNDIHSTDLFETWLSRAGGLPLSVKIHIGVDLEEDSTISAISDTFVEHSGRIRSLELETCIQHLKELENACGDWSFPLLQKLTICVLDGDGYHLRGELAGSAGSDGSAIEVFRNAPLLRQVSLVDAPSSFISLPSHQLTKFTGPFYSIADCLEVLRLGPNLTECAFSFAIYDVEAQFIPFTHLNLQSLTLFEAQPNTHDSLDSLDFLKALTLPALQTLQILDFETYVFNDNIFIEFLLRSSPPLRKFAVRLDDYTELETAFLLQMPELVDLEVWNPSRLFIIEFFDSFNGLDTSFLPKLQHLSFLGCRTPPSVYAMLELTEPGLTARWHARHQSAFAELASFRLVWAIDFGDIVEDALLPFQELAAEGMDIHIQGKTISYI